MSEMPTSFSSQPGLELRRMPDEYAMALILTGWKITKHDKYPVILGTALMIVAIAIAISKVPYVSHLASFPMVFLSVGHMYLVRKIIEGRPVAFSDVFHAFENSKWLNALMPLAIAGVAISFAQTGINKFVTDNSVFGAMLGSLVGLFLNLIWIALTAFSGPLIAFKGRTFGESIDLNIKCTTMNWKPLLIFGLMMMGVAVLCAIVFFLPLIFVFLPLVYVSGYLTYAAMFEGLDIVALGKMFEAKP